MNITHTNLVVIILKKKGNVMPQKLNMAPIFPDVKYTAGQPRLNYLPTKTEGQQFSQMAAMAPALYNLYRGWNAPDIGPVVQEEQRRFQQETLPSLMEQFAGGGSQGALLRGLQGAQGDIATRLGALRQQQQFELQKERQGLIPQLLNLGLSPMATPHLTDEEIQNVPQLLGSRIAQGPVGKEVGTIAKGAEDLTGQLLKGGRYIANELSDAAKDYLKSKGITLPTPPKTPASYETSGGIEALNKRIEDTALAAGINPQEASQLKFSPDLQNVLFERHKPLLKEIENITQRSDFENYLPFFRLLPQLKTVDDVKQFIKMLKSWTNRRMKKRYGKLEKKLGQ